MSQTEINELDARVIPPVDKHPTIFRTFDALANGDSFVLSMIMIRNPFIINLKRNGPMSISGNTSKEARKYFVLK